MRVRYPSSASEMSQTVRRRKILLFQLAVLPVDAAKARIKTSQSAGFLQRRFTSLVSEKRRWQVQNQTLHRAVSKTLLTPSGGCFSLQHAADNEPVMPTHSPHHLHSYVPLYYRAADTSCALPLAERSAWEVCVGGEEVTDPSGER